MTHLPFQTTFAARLRRLVRSPIALALLALPGCGEGEKRIECIDWDSNLGACLTKEEALAEFQRTESCGNSHQSVDSEAVEKNGQCCYEVTITDECCDGANCPIEGRPLLIDGESVRAGVVQRDTGWNGQTPENTLADLSAEERAMIGAMWLRAAEQEHASIASFGRFALELLRFGAPSALVAAAHSAALDEVRHAEACFALAARYTRGEVGPGALPVPTHLPLAKDLAALASAVVEEGCVGETVAAMFAAEQRSYATDGQVQRALDAIMREEAAHAELAWATLKWAVAQGGEPVRKAAVTAFERAAKRIEMYGSDAVTIRASTEVGAAHGRLSGAVFRRVATQTLRDVLLPCAEAMGVAPLRKSASISA
ncbi:MAG: ferritin-like domain-containing protein [Polyangiaceae bacterium]|nr:ferritin-like domain-containing protein [Polyangiaceae bacterium]